MDGFGVVFNRAVIMLRAVDVEAWAEWRAMRLAALRDAPYAFGAKIADWQGDRDSEHRWRQRLAGGSFNVVAELEGGAAGMASGVPTGQDDTVGLISMWVAPFARGRGVGDALVRAVLQWAERRGAARVVLQVAGDNDRATALYRRHGFNDSASPGPSRSIHRELVRVM